MIDDELIHWEEGLYVQPQHFQTLQRQMLRRLAGERRLLTPFPYGVVEAELDKERLSVAGGGRVEFKALRVVLKNGMVVHHGQNANVRPIDLTRGRLAGDKVTIYLAVRKPLPGRGVVPPVEALEDGADENDRLYRLERHTDVPDENTGADGTEMTTRVMNARLFAVGPTSGIPDPATWESLPVLRLIGSDPPLPDDKFAPPCFRLAGSEALKSVVEQIYTLVTGTRNAIASRATEPSAAPTRSEIEFLLSFKALTQHGAALSHALKAESLTPYDAYGLCLGLLGSLVGMRVRKSDAVTSLYDHDDPLPPFFELLKEIKANIPRSAPPYRKYDLLQIPGFPPEVRGCRPELALVGQRYTCVLAVGSDFPEHVNRVFERSNIIVGSPLVVQGFAQQQYIPWVPAPPNLAVEKAHREGGLTRYLLLDTSNLTGAGWTAVAGEGALGVRYADRAGQASSLQLNFLLLMLPPGIPVSS